VTPNQHTENIKKINQQLISGKEVSIYFKIQSGPIAASATVIA